jgi:hypothetical protein
MDRPNGPVDLMDHNKMHEMEQLEDGQSFQTSDL